MRRISLKWILIEMCYIYNWIRCTCVILFSENTSSMSNRVQLQAAVISRSFFMNEWVGSCCGSNPYVLFHQMFTFPLLSPIFFLLFLLLLFDLSKPPIPSFFLYLFLCFLWPELVHPSPLTSLRYRVMVGRALEGCSEHSWAKG